MSKVYLISDTHFNHAKIATYCQRPENFSETILKNLRRTLTEKDILIHLGDVYIGAKPPYLGDWPGRKILVRGNHDYHHSCLWWMTEGGFHFACDAMEFRGHWLSHRPDPVHSHVRVDCFNIHGHLHNVWDGFQPAGRVLNPAEHRSWQRLFAVEYTGYAPVEFEKWLSHPKKYKAVQPQD